VSNIRI